jgi:hypothetical protein
VRNSPIFLLGIFLLGIFLAGCASFTTTQTDVSSYDEQGKQTRTVTTRAQATTFFEGRSALASFKATQTDKTQSASVGGLNQEATGSNAVALAERIISAAVKAAVTP